MGLGDVKLSLTLGALAGWYGWTTVFTSVLPAFFAGAVYGGALLLRRRADRKTAMPFGPMMLLGALLSVLVVT